MEKQIKIGITMGDPAGIGPEIIVKALSFQDIINSCLPVVIGDIAVLRDTARDLGISGEINEIRSIGDAKSDGCINVLNLPCEGKLERGVVSKPTGKASGEFIKKGVDLAVDGQIEALVTAPINKESFNLGGFPYPGHTEFLASLTGAKDYAMMLMGESLKVVLLTIHCPLTAVSEKLSAADTLRISRLTDYYLKNYFAVKNPKIALASLNPHAGEGGMFGKEETEILLPAARAAGKEGINITDPQPSDTLFFKAVNGEFDAVICPYHDQGLIPLKLLHFDTGVNVTLGLPVIRTSPDHGTAYDLAGKGIAKPDSLKAAIMTAVDMAKAKKRLCGETVAVKHTESFNKDFKGV